jgi:hypothetical protein
MSETLMQNFIFKLIYNLNMINWYDDIVFQWHWIKNTKLLDGKRKIWLKCMSFKNPWLKIKIAEHIQF